MRSELKKLKEEVGASAAPALYENMMLIGHSMGGLISKMMLQSGGKNLIEKPSAK